MKALGDLLNLTGKVAIVTGGAKGIGQGIAYRLAEAGAKVLITDIDEPGAKQAAADIISKGWQAHSMRADVAIEPDVISMMQTCVDHFGGVDILVNNAGIYPVQPVADMTFKDMERVIHTNLLSVFMTTKHAAEVMKKRGGGKIINITSIDALHPSMVGLAHYDASKHGVWGFTKNAALELAPYNIQVNAIAPGGINTPGVSAMGGGSPSKKAAQDKQTADFIATIPMGRIGEPDDIGTVALFMASDMARYMTGSQIVVDGGALLN